MPEQQSGRGDVGITTSDFKAAFATPIYPFGMGGVNLAVAIDQIPVGQFARLNDVTWLPGEVRALTGRPGLTALVTGPPVGALTTHSIVRMNDPQAAATTLFFGMGTLLTQQVVGLPTVVTPIDSGYSGNPLTLLPHRPPLSSDPWLFVGDSLRMRQVRFDGLDLPIGLPAPSAPSVSVATAEKTQIATFSSTDATGVGDWTVNAGFTYDDPPTPMQTPEVILGGSPPSLTPAIQFGLLVNPPGTFLPNGGFVYFGCPITRNLNLVGSREASDDDIIHLWLYFTHALQVAEFRIYLVCSETFSADVLPGLPNAAGANGDAYVKSFSSNDFAAYIQSTLVQNSAAELARVRTVRDTSLRARGFNRRQGNPTSTTESTLAARDPKRNISTPAMPGSEVWQEFGIIGLPIRRGDFQRIGNSNNRDWSTITGIVTFIRSGDASGTCGVQISDLYLTGGNGPDTTEPDAVPYDYRVTNYDTRTGDEGNPSPELAESLWVDSVRQAINVDPAAYGDSAVRQRIYRRGGTRLTDWDFIGENTSDGGVFVDRVTDAEASGGGTLEIDHYQPVPTVNDAGDTVLAQPVPILFGPYQGQLYALGDPYRPGYVYACIPGESGNWPPDLAHEVSPPSEPLQSGVLFGGQPFVFSTVRGYTLYPNLSATGTMTSAPSGCLQGLASPWAITIGAGQIWGCSTSSVFRTSGGAETIISQKIEPLFRGQTVNGYLPIDFSTAAIRAKIRLQVFRDELYFQYQDTGGAIRTWVYQLLTGEWRMYTFATPPSALYADVEPTGTQQLLIGGAGVSGGAAYTHTGTSDVGAAIAPVIRTSAWDAGQPRCEKLWGDQILDVIGHDVDLSLQNFLNEDTVTNPAQGVADLDGTERRRVILDSFGQSLAGPQIARTVTTEITWSTTGTPPVLFYLGTSITLQPDLTINRVTNWDDGGHPDQKYLTGVTLDCHTGGTDRVIIIDRDWNGQFFEVTRLTVNADGRHKLPFSWAAVPCNQMRIRPDDTCVPWLLYRVDWIFAPEPPRIAGWDIHFENKWDAYYTGLDLYCDTEGETKRIVVEVDGVVLVNPATTLPYWEIVADGRRVVHLTLPWGRGHVFHFYATDTNVGLLYEHRWHIQEEPSEQHNWNQPFTILGTQADKYLKAVVIECDTFGEDVVVEVQSDEHDAKTSFTVNADGRQVRQIAFPQILGRVFRFFPTTSLPTRLYTLRPVFDEEPFQLTRWETQQIDHGLRGFHFLTSAMITLKSSVPVTLTITTYQSQLGTAIATDAYVIPSTGGIKDKRFVPFVARKGVLYKYLFTVDGDNAFWLYGAESYVTLQDWQGGGEVLRHPFGDDDADPTREMVNSTLAAGRSGGDQ